MLTRIEARTMQPVLCAENTGEFDARLGRQVITRRDKESCYVAKREEQGPWLSRMSAQQLGDWRAHPRGTNLSRWQYSNWGRDGLSPNLRGLQQLSVYALFYGRPNPRVEVRGQEGKQGSIRGGEWLVQISRPLRQIGSMLDRRARESTIIISSANRMLSA